MLFYPLINRKAGQGLSILLEWLPLDLQFALNVKSVESCVFCERLRLQANANSFFLASPQANFSLSFT